MLREAQNAGYAPSGGVVRRRWRFVAGGVACERSVTRRTHAEQARAQEERPVAVAGAADGRRRYWWFHGRFWWEDDGLGEADVMALVLERERRLDRRLDQARAMMAGEVGAGRPGIPVEVKRRVWERCGGRCVECGGESLLEFDHVIPVVMGGSSGERNLQLLCADCNRRKGGGL